MKTKNRKFRKILKTLTALLCALLVLYPPFVEPVKSIAEEPKVYLSDLKLYVFNMWADPNGKETIAKANAEGYSVYVGNLNAGTSNSLSITASTGDRLIDPDSGIGIYTNYYIYIGYKTTKNVDEAITDIRTLGMDRDYYLYNYNDFKTYLKNSNQGTAYSLFNATGQFIANYKKGSPKALDAYDGLNLFYVDEAKMNLGDYIVQGKASYDLFTDLVIRASSATVTTIFNYMNMGIAPYNTAEANWAFALQNSDLLYEIEHEMTEHQLTELDKQYDDDATAIFEKIQDFTVGFDNASVRKNYAATGVIDYSIANEAGQDIKTNADIVAAMDTVPEEDADAFYLSAYEIMNRYTYNDTPLGDWMLEIGHMTSEEVNMREIYPMVEAMGEAQAGLVRTVGFLAAVSNLSANVRNDQTQALLPEIRDTVREYEGTDSISIWRNADDDLGNSFIAYTSDAIRKSDSNNSIGKKSKFDVIDEKLTTVMKWIEVGVGALMVGAYVIQSMFAITGSIVGSFTASAACTAVASVCSSIVAGLAIASTCLMWASVIVLAITIGWAIGKWIAGGIKKACPTLKHTNMPAYVFEAVDTPDGAITVKYKSVYDNRNTIGDVNGLEQTKWQILCYTKDKNVGSPIIADKDGNFFKRMVGNSAKQEGYDCINFFGERGPANMNSYCEKDSLNGIYISYCTERSAGNAGAEGGENKGEGSASAGQDYLLDVIVSTAKTADAAKAKIVSKEGKYYVLDYNASTGTDNYTYIGYSMTTDPELAITDMRIAPYHGTDSVTFGDVSYSFAGFVGNAQEDGDNSLSGGDALMITRDEKAGSPIPADGLHFVTNFADAKPGWEPVALFSGYPYNFSTWYEQFEDAMMDTKPVVSGYWTKKSNNWDRTRVYLFYEPSVKYTSGTSYLAGFFCLQGYKIKKTAAMVFSQTKCDMGQFKDIALEYPYARLIETNLAQSVIVEMGSGHDRVESYLGFVWTYNPKRAITDIVLYQGDTYQNTLPYTISKPSGTVSMGYVATTTVCQQGLDGSTDMKASRFISTTNAIINDRALLVMGDDYDWGVLEGYTYSLARGFNFSYKKANFLPLGLYVSGAATGKAPLKLNDVVFSTNTDAKTGVVEDGEIVWHLSNTLRTLGLQSVDEKTAFHAIMEVKDPYATEAISVAYPEWYTKKDDKKSCSYLYIYIKGSLPAKPRYISSVALGSYSREQYKRDLQQKKAHVSDDEIKAIDAAVNSSAMISAASACSGEIIPVNLATLAGESWYERSKDGKANSKAPENTPAAYIGVSRTDKASQAITAVMLYQNDATTTAAKIKIDGAEYYCDTPSTPLVLNGKKYYLYYTRNRGVLSGARVEDIIIDTTPILSGTSSALSGKVGSNTTYGEGGFRKFIHMAFEQQDGTYIQDLFLGKGTSQNNALSELISQECYQYINIDLNCAAGGSWIYLGYSSGNIDMSTATASKIRRAWNEAVWDIIVTRNEPFHEEGIVSEKTGIYYAPVSSINLNDGIEGLSDELYMYYCSPYLSEEYNEDHKANTALPTDVFTAPITKMAFARYDRVPYNTSLEGTTNEAASTAKAWEYVMFADHSRPAEFNAGAVKLQDMTDNRVTMFVQRYDGSVKPAGQITGGFLTDVTGTGNISIQ